PTSISGPHSRRAFGRASRKQTNSTPSPHESWTVPEHAAKAGAQDQSPPLPGDGPALHAAPGPSAASEARAPQQSLPRHGRAGGGRRGGGGREERARGSRRA